MKYFGHVIIEKCTVSNRILCKTGCGKCPAGRYTSCLKSLNRFDVSSTSLFCIHANKIKKHNDDPWRSKKTLHLKKKKKVNGYRDQ